jgi:hypothetical protein
VRFLERLLGDEAEKEDVLGRMDSLEDRVERLERILDVEAEETIRIEAEGDEWERRGRRSRDDAGR